LIAIILNKRYFSSQALIRALWQERIAEIVADDRALTEFGHLVMLQQPTIFYHNEISSSSNKQNDASFVCLHEGKFISY